MGHNTTITVTTMDHVKASYYVCQALAIRTIKSLRKWEKVNGKIKDMDQLDNIDIDLSFPSSEIFSIFESITQKGNKDSFFDGMRYLEDLLMVEVDNKGRYGFNVPLSSVGFILDEFNLLAEFD